MSYAARMRVYGGEAHAIAHSRNLAVFTRDGTALKWAQRMGVPGISTVGILN
jgi:predicted nucleic acid-binding protein